MARDRCPPQTPTTTPNARRPARLGATARCLALAALVVSAPACANDVLTSSAASPSILVAIEAEGMSYLATDEATLSIDLGDVPLLTTAEARYRVTNEGTSRLVVFSIAYGVTEGATWETPLVETPPAASGSRSSADGFSLEPGEAIILVVPYAPVLVGAASAELFLLSNDTQSSRVGLAVAAQGQLNGAPDIEVAYGGWSGPDAADCQAGAVAGAARCVVPAGHGLDFGNIAPNTMGIQTLTLRNVASCPTSGAAEASCSRCALAIRPDPDGAAVGLGLAVASSANGDFSFFTPVSLPLIIGTRDVACGESGEVELQIAFQAGSSRGPAASTLIIESTDPDEPLIEIPITANVTEAPVAVADFVRCAALGTSSNCTDPAAIEPLDRVYLHGDDSYDPPNAPAASDIAAYRWEVITSPPGANPDDFAPLGADASHFSFVAILAGHYVVQLTVWNAAGVASGDTADSRLELDVIPGDELHLQLVWDDDANDLDLHLANLAIDDRVCSEVGDCHYKNCMESCLDPAGCYDAAVWFTDEPAFRGPNPVLDRDDTHGYGPENLNIDSPRPGSYRVYVHYWTDYGTPTATPSTVRIYANGLLYAEYTRTLPERNAVWAVATVEWNDDGTPTITPYPSDAAGEIGAVATMGGGCQLPGWYFP